MKGISYVLDNVKLRYSYGSSGNQGISSYQTFAILSAVNYPFGSGMSNGYVTNINNPGNSALTWETTWQHDAGIELDFSIEYIWSWTGIVRKLQICCSIVRHLQAQV